MEEQFVTYEIALKLKELGFDEKCFAIYDAYQDNRLVYLCEDGRNHSGTIKTNASMDFSCLAPLWQQVIDWFIEEHNIFIEITYEGGLHKDTSLYSFQLWSNQTSNKSDKMSYCEAREQAILKAIELCKNN